MDPPASKSPQTERAAPAKRFVTARIVPDKTPVKEAIPAQTDFTNLEAGLQDALGEPGSATIPAPDNLMSGAGNAPDGPAYEIKDYVEHMPEFPGGMKQLYDFIRRHLSYPNEAQRLGLEGTVVVTFVVGKNGEIFDIKVIKDVGGGTAEEAIRVIRNMKPWQPGQQNGQPVPVRFTLPLRFSLAS